MSSQSRTTTDHDRIRRWVEDHDGVPSGGGEPHQIGWDDRLEKFENQFALRSQEHKADGSESTSFKLVSR